jgi:hypothetical protein
VEQTEATLRLSEMAKESGILIREADEWYNIHITLMENPLYTAIDLLKERAKALKEADRPIRLRIVESFIKRIESGEWLNN